MINLTRGFRCCLRMPKSWFSGAAKYLTGLVLSLVGKPRKNDKDLDKSSLKKLGQKGHRFHQQPPRPNLLKQHKIAQFSKSVASPH